MKRCSKCKEYKPANIVYFQKDKQKRDGLRPDCKECRSLSYSKRIEGGLCSFHGCSNKPRKGKKTCSICATKQKEADRKYYTKFPFVKRPVREIANLYACKYRSKKLQRHPVWCDEQKYKQIFENCPKGMEIDHIIPIQGKNVSGLDIPENLQYLSIKDNKRKFNKFKPYQSFFYKTGTYTTTMLIGEQI